MHKVICAGCSQAFQAKTTRAKWHDAACRKRTQRAAAKAPPARRARRKPATKIAASKTAAPDRLDRHGLVISTRRALEEAGKLDTFAGQLALQLARKLANPDESGVSSLSKELRTVMDAVIGGGTSAGREERTGQEANETAEDEVTRAREARAQARQAAGLT